MTHGIQIFDPSGDLIFDSRTSRPLIVHDYGTLTITGVPGLGDPFEGDPQALFWVNFRPTTRTPRIYIPNFPFFKLGRYVGISDIRLIWWGIRPAERNSQNEWYRFGIEFLASGIAKHWNFPSGDYHPPLPWYLPWVVFVEP